MLTLCPATLPKVFISSVRFLFCFTESLRSFRYRMSLANRDTLTHPFPFLSFLFLSFFLLLRLRILNKSRESMHSSLIPDFRWNAFRISLSSTMLALGLSYIMFRYVPSIPSYFRAFMIEEWWVLFGEFSASIEMIMRFFSLLILLMCCIILIDLHMLNNPCIHGIKPTRSSFLIFLMCCWNFFASILLRNKIYESMFIKEIDL
jgi:hypothetical protein